MKITFNREVLLEITTGYDDVNDYVYTEEEVFPPHEVHEVDIEECEDKDRVNIQFGDGSVAYCVPTKLFSEFKD